MGTLSLTDFTALTEITSAGHNANNAALESWSTALSDDNFAASAGMYAAYKTLLAGSSIVMDDASAAATWIFTGNGVLLQSATSTSVATSRPAPVMDYFDDADFTISGRTQKLRLRAQLLTNATVPAITLTSGLYEITAVAGGTDALTVTVGAAVSGSTVAFASPAASTRHQNNSGDFTIPADGHYALCVATSAAMTANAVAVVSAQLQTRHV